MSIPVSFRVTFGRLGLESRAPSLDSDPLEDSDSTTWTFGVFLFSLPGLDEDAGVRGIVDSLIRSSCLTFEVLFEEELGPCFGVPFSDADLGVPLREPCECLGVTFDGFEGPAIGPEDCCRATACFLTVMRLTMTVEAGNLDSSPKKENMIDGGVWRLF